MLSRELKTIDYGTKLEIVYDEHKKILSYNTTLTDKLDDNLNKINDSKVKIDDMKSKYENKIFQPSKKEIAVDFAKLFIEQSKTFEDLFELIKSSTMMSAFNIYELKQLADRLKGLTGITFLNTDDIDETFVELTNTVTKLQKLQDEIENLKKDHKDNQEAFVKEIKDLRRENRIYKEETDKNINRNDERTDLICIEMKELIRDEISIIKGVIEKNNEIDSEKELILNEKYEKVIINFEEQKMEIDATVDILKELKKQNIQLRWMSLGAGVIAVISFIVNLVN